jgi:hypothetical protein
LDFGSHDLSSSQLQRSPLQRLRGADARGCLGRQRQLKPLEQHLHVRRRLGAPHQQQFVPVSSGHNRIQPLHGRESLKHTARHQAASDFAQLLAQGERQAVGEERDKEVRLYPVWALVTDRPKL